MNDYINYGIYRLYRQREDVKLAVCGQGTLFPFVPHQIKGVP